MGLRDSHRREIEDKAIDINANMQGTLSFKDPVNLKINGNFNGTMECRGTLTIGSTASVDAHIIGDNIVIAGKVRGEIIAKKMIVMMPTAVLNGNISTPKLNIVEGAIFQGKCQMLDEFLDVDELSKYLEIESSSILELAKSGKIPAARNGDNWRFERSRIDEWIATEKVK